MLEPAKPEVSTDILQGDAGELDLALLAAFHRHHPLFLAYRLEGEDEPRTLLLDGDPGDLVDQLVEGAAFAREIRAEIHARPYQQARKAVNAVLELLRRRRPPC